MKEEAIEFNEWKREVFATRPDVKREYDALAPRYAIINAMLDAPLKRGTTPSATP